MKNQIKELRVKIDGLGQLTKNLKPVKEVYAKGGVEGELSKNVNSKEIEKAIDSLILGKAWLGKILGELGAESPYPKDGTRETVEDIEKTADEADLSDYYVKPLSYENKSHIEKVDWLREEIKEIVKTVEVLDYGLGGNNTTRPSREFAISRTNTYNYLSEARFWLGFELQRIREDE